MVQVEAKQISVACLDNMLHRDMPANKTLKISWKKVNIRKKNYGKKDRDGIRRELEERERNVRDKQPSQRPSSDTKTNYI